MSKFKWIKTLPWLALFGAVLALVSILITAPQNTAQRVDTGVTRPAAEAVIDRLAALEPLSTDVPAFRTALDQALQEPYVATLWVFSPDASQLLYAAGSTAGALRNSENLTDNNTAVRLIEALPQETLSAEQKGLLLSTGAMLIEGEHNDIYRHLVRPLYAPDHTLLGYLGLAYAINPTLGTPSLLYVLGLLAFLFGLALYWLSLPLWVYLDARSRAEKAAVWAIFTLLGNLAALIAYLLVRKEKLD